MLKMTKTEGLGVTSSRCPDPGTSDILEFGRMSHNWDVLLLLRHEHPSADILPSKPFHICFMLWEAMRIRLLRYRLRLSRSRHPLYDRHNAYSISPPAENNSGIDGYRTKTS